MKKSVKTNIGEIPIDDYREIIAEQNGFDCYDDMYFSGCRIGSGYDYEYDASRFLKKILEVKEANPEFPIIMIDSPSLECKAFDEFCGLKISECVMFNGKLYYSDDKEELAKEFYSCDSYSNSEEAYQDACDRACKVMMALPWKKSIIVSINTPAESVETDVVICSTTETKRR